MLSYHINVKLTGTHLDAFKAFGTRTTPKGETPKTPKTLERLIETTPEHEALTGIKSEYGKNPQPRPIDESGGEDGS